MSYATIVVDDYTWKVPTSYIDSLKLDSNVVQENNTFYVLDVDPDSFSKVITQLRYGDVTDKFAHDKSRYLKPVQGQYQNGGSIGDLAEQMTQEMNNNAIDLLIGGSNTNIPMTSDAMTFALDTEIEQFGGAPSILGTEVLLSGNKESINKFFKDLQPNLQGPDALAYTMALSSDKNMLKYMTQMKAQQELGVDSDPVTFNLDTELESQVGGNSLVDELLGTESVVSTDREYTSSVTSQSGGRRITTRYVTLS